MRITGLGHAGLKVETSGATILLDPWFSPQGAFQGSWFPFPDNSHLFQPSLLNPTAVVISHEHLDHVDPWFLSHLPPSVPVVIPQYPSPVLLRKVESGGPRTIIEVPPWERLELAPGTSIFFISEQSPMNHDSAIVICGDDKTVLNLNDARLFPMQFRGIRAEVGGRIDVFAFQGAGASWYPICYEFPAERKAELSSRKRQAKLSYVARSLDVLEPEVALPFAGPPCFLDPTIFGHNAEMEAGIFPDQEQVAAWLLERGRWNVQVLLPGDSWDHDLRLKDPDEIWEGFSFKERWPYLEAYADRRRLNLAEALAGYQEPVDSLYEPFREYFEALLAMSPYFNRRIGLRVGFDVEGAGGGRWHVDFRPGSEGVGNGLEECGYVLRFESRWLPPLIGNVVPWEDFFLSLRFQAWREPDVYNDHLLGLLKFAQPKALASVEAFETSLAIDEMITINAEGKSSSIGRFCPHAGNDLLTTGEVLPGGIIRCLAHHYEFDLETGECVNGSCPPLEVGGSKGLHRSSLAERAGKSLLVRPTPP
jgi:UDP-MurNAc hydroxylase